MRTERRRSRFTGGTYPWIVESTAMVNHYYFDCVDEDFGPFFLKFCSYFPYNAKLAVSFRDALDEAMKAQPTQIVGGASRGQLAGLFPQQRSKMLT
jgi:hypothetical protein